MPCSSRLLPMFVLSLAALCASAGAQEAVIRKTLPERLPQLPKIDEVNRTPIPGLWEVRYGGTEILYSDDKGEHIVVNGSLVETKTRTDLTEARIEKLQAVSWDKLPMKDAVLIPAHGEQLFNARFGQVGARLGFHQRAVDEDVLALVVAVEDFAAAVAHFPQARNRRGLDLVDLRQLRQPLGQRLADHRLLRPRRSTQRSQRQHKHRQQPRRT